MFFFLLGISAKPSKIYQYEKIFWIFKNFKCNFGEDRVEKKEKVACKKWKFHRGAFKNGTFTEMYILLGTWVPTLMKISFFDSFLNSTIKFQNFLGAAAPRPPPLLPSPAPLLVVNSLQMMNCTAKNARGARHFFWGYYQNEFEKVVAALPVCEKKNTDVSMCGCFQRPDCAE